MIAISCWIFYARTCRILKARAELGARTPSSFSGWRTSASAYIERVIACARARQPSLSPSAACLSPVLPRALTRRYRASGSPESRRATAGERERWRWGSGRDSCVWPCCAASCAWIRSMGNTSKASSTPKRWALLVPLRVQLVSTCDNDIDTNWQESGSDSTAHPHVGPFRRRREGFGQFSVNLPGIFARLLAAAVWHTHLRCSVSQLRAICVRVCVSAVAYISPSLPWSLARLLPGERHLTGPAAGGYYYSGLS